MRPIKFHLFLDFGKNADTEDITKIPNSYGLVIWDLLLVPGADIEWFCLGYGGFCFFRVRTVSAFLS